MQQQQIDHLEDAEELTSTTNHLCLTDKIKVFFNGILTEKNKCWYCS